MTILMLIAMLPQKPTSTVSKFMGSICNLKSHLKSVHECINGYLEGSSKQENDRTGSMLNIAASIVKLSSVLESIMASFRIIISTVE